MIQYPFANRNLFLIGMMGSWKSTVGKKLAERLQVKYIDVDDVIEAKIGKKIRDYFTDHSEQNFRDLEAKTFKELIKADHQIISTGGGIVLREENRHILKNQGTTILLKATPACLATRIKNTEKRPLLAQAANKKETLEKIWKTRKQFYIDSAHIIIETDHLKPSTVISELKNFIAI